MDVVIVDIGVVGLVVVDGVIMVIKLIDFFIIGVGIYEMILVVDVVIWCVIWIIVCDFVIFC